MFILFSIINFVFPFQRKKKLFGFPLQPPKLSIETQFCLMKPKEALFISPTPSLKEQEN
jgi:hypothetical protein